MELTSGTSLRALVLAQTDQDVNRCSSCALCEDVMQADGDVSVAMLLQWIMANDERALTCRAVWSDEVLRQTNHACASQLDIPAILLALRHEASRRGLHKET